MYFEEEDQQFTFFGTELDPIKEDDVVRKKPLRIEDEVATDEQGRRRFHGAFTGGFSAGYFNTVGSKEGWAPSTFKSSRDKRGDGGVRRPEDYMDDEDRGIFGIAPQVLRPTEDFRDKATKKRRPLDSTGTIPGVPVLHDLLRPVKETIGVRLLRVMGWRPGQGVGERITQREKKARAKKMANTKVYGCLLPPELASRSSQDEIGESEEESEDDIELDAQILYAPDDIPPFLVKPKENSFGLGYVGLAPELANKNEKKKLLFEPTLSITDKNKRLRIAGQAFGVGAFENEDEDIYAKDDMSRYDFVLGGPPEKKRKEMPALTYDSPYVEGFEPAKERPPVFKVYPPPSLPHNFAPFHKASKSRWDIPPELYYPLREIQSQKPSSAKLKATDRGALLKTQAELKAIVIAKAAQAPPEPPKIIEKVHDAETLAKIETLNKEIQDNLSRDPERFKPFTKDPPKQERYEAYMVLTRLGKKDEFGLLQPLNMTEWEKSREINEFDRASMLFKPMKGAIGNRFVSGGQVEENVPGGLGVFDPTVHQVKEMFPKRMEPGDERKNAACMKLYGKMTRETSEWHPDRMLCIRFNVPNPFPELADMKKRPNRPTKRDKYSIFDFLSVDSPDNLNINSKPSLQAIEPPKTITAEDLPSQPFAATQQNGNQNEIQPQNIEQSATAQSLTTQETFEDESMDQQEEKEQRPPMDLFKAIFEDESEDEKGEPTKVESAQETSSKPSPKPTPATQSKPNIFANLDLINPPTLSREKTPVIDDVPTDAYGPKVPSKLNTASINPVLASSSGVVLSRDRKNEPEEEEWVEATSKSRNKKTKKEKHKKSKKKKSKTHKKSKRKSNSDSSSDDSDSDLDAVLSRKLKKLKKNM